jgi:hypothetical protein
VLLLSLRKILFLEPSPGAARSRCLQLDKGLDMSISQHKRQQSELCRRLAHLASDGEVQARLLQMANEYMEKAARAEAADGEFSLEADPSIAAARNPTPYNLAYD